VPVGVSVAPVIPGLNDEELPRLLEAARDAGATSASWQLLRLPGSVKAVFEERLRAALPDQAERVLHRIRETRGGALDDARFGVRGRGKGPLAGAVADLFRAAARRAGLDRPPPGCGAPGAERSTPFRRPRAQLSLLP
jgi:DNA repair photolyase